MLKTEEEYGKALIELWRLMDEGDKPEPDTPEEKELVRLATLVEAYEDEHYPIALPTEEKEALQCIHK